MSESEFVEYLEEIFQWSANEDGVIEDTRTFESAGLMTSNEGLVVRLDDGSEFQVSVVRSR